MNSSKLASLPPTIRLLFPFLLLGILIFFPAKTVNGQQRLTFDSLFTTETGISGKSKFGYYLKNGEKVRDGQFEFSSEQKESEDETLRRAYYWKGQFKDGLKTGTWIYEEDLNKAMIHSIQKGGMTYALLTTENSLKLNYKDGFPDGPVELKSSRYRNGKWEKDLEVFKASFQDKRIQGSFNYSRNGDSGEEISINGETVNGFFDGTWLIHHPRDSIWEEREYRSGVLISLVKTLNDDTLLSLGFPLSPRLTKEIDDGASGFKLVDHPVSLAFSDGYPSSSKYMASQETANRFIQEVLDKVFQYDQSLEYQFGLPIGATRGIYELSTEEEEAIVSWKEEEEFLKEKVDDFKGLSLGNLEFLNDTILHGIHLWTKRQDPIMEKIISWSKISQGHGVIYYYREGLLVDHAEKILSADNIFISGRNRLIHYDKGVGEGKRNFLIYVSENLKRRNHFADSLYKVALKELDAHQYAKQLFDLNESIKQERHLEDSLYSELPTTLSLGQTLEQTNNFFFEKTFPAQYEIFIGAKDAQRQMDIGFKIITELKKLDELLFLAKEIENMMPVLDSVYTEYLFDPFTYTDKVPNRVKKKLYEPVINEMIPQGIQLAKEQYEDPFKVFNQLNDVRSVQIRLLKLRYANTQKLEKKMKHAKSFDAKWTLIMEE